MTTIAAAAAAANDGQKDEHYSALPRQTLPSKWGLRDIIVVKKERKKVRKKSKDRDRQWKMPIKYLLSG